MDQIQAMRIYVRVVEAGTFTRAADSLSLPKATVTKHVQALEERLRVKLLNRTTRRVTVTADGAAYYERTVRLLTDLDDIEASMTNARSNPRGRLRVDVGTGVARLLIIPNLAEFHARYPDIQVDLGVSDRVVDLIGDNVDCVIRGGELSDQSLVARRIGNLEFITVASPGYLERHGTPQHPIDIESRHNSVIYFSPQSGRHYPLEFRKGDESIDITGPYLVSVNESNAYLSAALAGLGVAQITTFQATPYLDNGSLVQLLPEWSQPLLPVYVVYPPNRHLSAKVRAFVDWAAELFQREPHLQRTAAPSTAPGRLMLAA
jgi:DNA-binding transcriptional LysR family regulator